MATRLTLRTNARARADQDSSTFPTDPQYNMYLDRAASMVWRRLVASGWKPARTVLPLTATGATSYVLGPDVYEVLSVMALSAGNRIPLRRAKPAYMPYLLANAGQATHFDLLGGATTSMSIELYPTPASGSYEVRYLSRFTGFTADTDVWNGPDGSDELIELGAAIRGVRKEDGDASGLVAEYKSVWEEVISGAHWVNEPETVNDTRTNDEYLPFDYNIVGIDV